jgi:hypothetical protein
VPALIAGTQALLSCVLAILQDLSQSDSQYSQLSTLLQDLLDFEDELATTQQHRGALPCSSALNQHPQATQTQQTPLTRPASQAPADMRIPVVQRKTMAPFEAAQVMCNVVSLFEMDVDEGEDVCKVRMRQAACSCPTTL